MPDSSHDTTSLHLRAAMRGDKASLDWIVRKFHPFVERVAFIRLGRRESRLQDAGDLAQEAWLRVLDRLQDLKARDGRLGPVLMSFLASTVKLLANNHLRKQGHRRTVQASASSAGESAPDPLDLVEAETTRIVSRVARKETQSQVTRCFEQLSPEERDVLALRVCEGSSCLKASRLLGVSRHQVGALYRSGLRGLRACLDPEDRDLLRVDLRPIRTATR